jgi:hypothetical protein
MKCWKYKNTDRGVVYVYENGRDVCVVHTSSHVYLYGHESEYESECGTNRLIGFMHGEHTDAEIMHFFDDVDLVDAPQPEPHELDQEEPAPNHARFVTAQAVHKEGGIDYCPLCCESLPAPLVDAMVAGTADCPVCRASTRRCRHASCMGLLFKDWSSQLGRMVVRCQDCGNEVTK